MPWWFCGGYGMGWRSTEKGEDTFSFGRVLRIRSYVPLKGKGVKVADGACPNPLYVSAVIKEPVVSKLINPQVPVLYRTYEYDIVTQPGEDYSLERSM